MSCSIYGIFLYPGVILYVRRTKLQGREVLTRCRKRRQQKKKKELTERNKGENMTWQVSIFFSFPNRLDGNLVNGYQRWYTSTLVLFVFFNQAGTIYVYIFYLFVYYCCCTYHIWIQRNRTVRCEEHTHAPFFFLTLPLLAVAQIRGHIAGCSPSSRSHNSEEPLGHIAGSSPSFPLRFVPCSFIARRLHSALSSLVDSRRIAPPPTLYRRSQQFILFSSFFFVNEFKISPHGGIGTHGPTLFMC